MLKNININMVNTRTLIANFGEVDTELKMNKLALSEPRL